MAYAIGSIKGTELRTRQFIPVEEDYDLEFTFTTPAKRPTVPEWNPYGKVCDSPVRIVYVSVDATVGVEAYYSVVDLAKALGVTMYKMLKLLKAEGIVPKKVLVKGQKSTNWCNVVAPEDFRFLL